MKTIIIFLLSNALSIALGIGSIYLAAKGISAWWAFLLAAILTGVSIAKYKE